MELRSRRHRGVAAIEKGAFWSPSTRFADFNRLIGLVGRVFANGVEDLGSIPGRFIPKTLKIVLDTSKLNT